jgi:hypothetical protein
VKRLRALTDDEFNRAAEYLRNPPPGSNAVAARLFGIDLTLVIGQLRLSPAERVQRMLEACETASKLRGLARQAKS